MNEAQKLIHRLNNGQSELVPDQPARDDRCGTCRYSVYEDAQQQNGVCHLNPPQVITIPSQDRITGQVKIGIQSVFAPVDRLSWCAQWKPAIETLLERAG